MSACVAAAAAAWHCHASCGKNVPLVLLPSRVLQHHQSYRIPQDDCLYRNEAIPNKVRLRIMEFMVTRLGIEEAGVEALCTRLYISHGTTMAGLIVSAVMRRQ